MHLILEILFKIFLMMKILFKIFLVLKIFRYGVGMIYQKQEKFSLAEVHFRKALSINPKSPALLCHIGVVSKKTSWEQCTICKCYEIQNYNAYTWQNCDWLQVQHAQQKSEKALITLNNAISIEPKNPLCRFHRASILFSIDKYKVL